MTDPQTQLQADSIARQIMKQRDQLQADLAAHNASCEQLRADQAKLAKEWQIFDEKLRKHAEYEAIVQRREAEVLRQKNDLETREVGLNRREDWLKVREVEHDARHAEISKREGVHSLANVALADRAAEVEERDRRLALKEEDYRVRMWRLREIVEAYFRAPSK